MRREQIRRVLRLAQICANHARELEGNVAGRVGAVACRWKLQGHAKPRRREIH
jgi:hypothetical protein